MILEERIRGLELELARLQEKLKNFKPVTVDLRIDGKVRPVVLFAQDSLHQDGQVVTHNFTVVNKPIEP